MTAQSASAKETHVFFLPRIAQITRIFFRTRIARIVCPVDKIIFFPNFRPIAHFAGCDPAQELIATGVLRDSNVSWLNLMVENAQ